MGITLCLNDQDWELGNPLSLKTIAKTVDIPNVALFRAGSSSVNNLRSHYFSTGQLQYIFIEGVIEGYSETSEIYFNRLAPIREHRTRSCIFLATMQGAVYNLHTQETIFREEDLVILFNFLGMLLVLF